MNRDGSIGGFASTWVENYGWRAEIRSVPPNVDLNNREVSEDTQNKTSFTDLDLDHDACAYTGDIPYLQCLRRSCGKRVRLRGVIKLDQGPHRGVATLTDKTWSIPGRGDRLSSLDRSLRFGVAGCLPRGHSYL